MAIRGGSPGAAGRQVGELTLDHVQGLGASPPDGLQVQAPDDPAGDAPRGRVHHLGVDEGVNRDHPGDFLDFVGHLGRVREGRPVLEHDDVGVDAENFFLQIQVEAGHHPDDHDEGHDPDHDPGHGDEGGERQEAFLALDAPEQPQGYERFEEMQGGYLSGLRRGNKMTSRMEGASVKSITRRSMPMPSPAVGGMPWDRAVT